MVKPFKGLCQNIYFQITIASAFLLLSYCSHFPQHADRIVGKVVARNVPALTNTEFFP